MFNYKNQYYYSLLAVSERAKQLFGQYGAGGQANVLRTLIKTEINRGPDFLRLANALSALYPKGSEEKRLLDAMLQAVPR